MGMQFVVDVRQPGALEDYLGRMNLPGSRQLGPVREANVSSSWNLISVNDVLITPSEVSSINDQHVVCTTGWFDAGLTA